MTFRRTWGLALATALAGVLLLPACSRRKPVEVNPIVPSIKVNRTKAPLGSALEITYTWTLEPGAQKLDQDYRALVHFLDNHDVMLFEDDHMPGPAARRPGSRARPTATPAPASCRSTPTWARSRSGWGSTPIPGRGERPALKGEDRGLPRVQGRDDRAPAADREHLPGLQGGLAQPRDAPREPGRSSAPGRRRKRSCPSRTRFQGRSDVIVYLEADTCVKCFTETPELTVTVGNNVGLRFPIDDPQVFLKKIRVKAEDLGDGRVGGPAAQR